jgi:hypothetical protein
VAEKTFDGAEATTEDSPVSLWLDSPYQISKIIGELYGNYYTSRLRAAVRQGALSERLRPGRGARRRALARHGQHRLAQRHARRSSIARSARGAAGRERRHRHARLIYVEDMARGLQACACAAVPARSTTSASAARRRSASWPRRSTS